MLKRLVQILMQDDSAALLVCQRIHEAMPIERIPPVGTRSRNVIAHLGLANHDDPRIQTILRVLHQPHVILLNLLLD